MMEKKMETTIVLYGGVLYTDNGKENENYYTFPSFAQILPVQPSHIRLNFWFKRCCS